MAVPFIGVQQEVRTLVTRSGRISRGHFFTALSAGLTGYNALLHIAYPPAIFRTLGANLCAFLAGMLVMRRIDKHEMRRGPANFRAGHH